MAFLRVAVAVRAQTTTPLWLLANCFAVGIGFRDLRLLPTAALGLKSANNCFAAAFGLAGEALVQASIRTHRCTSTCAGRLAGVVVLPGKSLHRVPTIPVKAKSGAHIAMLLSNASHGWGFASRQRSGVLSTAKRKQLLPRISHASPRSSNAHGEMVILAHRLPSTECAACWSTQELRSRSPTVTEKCAAVGYSPKRREPHRGKVRGILTCRA